MNFQLKIFLILLFAGIFCRAQDIHFSQFENSPLNLNPANTGLISRDLRLCLNHRNQWSSITNPYKTSSVSLDHSLKKVLANKFHFGIALLINSDQAGDADFGFRDMAVSSAIHYFPKKDKSISVSLGISLNFRQFSYDYNSLTFGSQFTGVFDPQSSTGENVILLNDNKLNQNLNIGTYAGFKLKNNKKIGIGFSFLKIGKNNPSFFESQEIDNSSVFRINSDFSMLLNERWKILPYASFSSLQKENEFVIGSYGRFQTDNMFVHGIYAGLFTRFSDALIISSGIDYLDMKITMSYDINYSKLTTASRGRGAFEISMIYQFDLSRSYKIPEKALCPIVI